MAQKQSSNLGSWLTPEEHKALRGIAKRDNRTVIALLRLKVAELIEQDAKGNTTCHVEERFNVQILRGARGHKLITIRDNEAHDPDNPDYDPDNPDYEILMHAAEAEDLANKLRVASVASA